MFLEKNRTRIQEDFEAFSRELPKASREIKKRMEALDGDVVLAMKYLYANMPYSDVGNYSFDTYLDYATQGLYLWENSPYIQEYSEEFFLNYVLFHRVNEEEIRPCRALFWNKLKERIAGLDMEQAILEINHWCTQEVTYQSTDGRTGSALEVYRCGFGRCGEESVFAVNALRSAGIPARQVYAPRWSHCDDNHAWVEVWCNGQWHFTGACEAEAVLDRGWFNGAASRAMMVSSRWFDRALPSGEDVIGRDGMTLALNQLDRYAKTGRITIRVEDLEGYPVEKATVWAEILNYSEFSPIAKMETDENGTVSFNTGKGSLHICAAYEGEYGECVVNTQEGDSFVCVLGEEILEDSWVDFDMTAPADEAKGAVTIPRELETANRQRVAQETQKCRKKIRKFRPLWKDCLYGHDPETMEELMSVLSDKDRNDVFPEVLEEHYQEAAVYRELLPKEIFLPYVWNPRVEDEVLTKWRRSILERFGGKQQEEFRSDPRRIWSWIQENISVKNDKERVNVYTTPAAALELGIAGKKSHKVLFVAIARTLGIPARVNRADGAMEYWNGREFVRVLPERKRDAHVTFLAEEGDSWNYFRNWTVARTKGLRYRTLNLMDCHWEGGRLEVDVESGDYRILTANRVPSGNIFAKRYDFHLEPGETKTIRLELREVSFSDMLDCHRLPDFYLQRKDGGEILMSQITDGARGILFWLDVGKEPTEHILNELMERQEEYKKIQDSLSFILRGPEALADLTLQKCLGVLPDVRIFYDEFGKDREMTARGMYTDPEKLPLLVVTDGPCTGIFAAAGYSVGMADMLLRVLKS